MNRIRLLPDEVARKIAAGEVVERPASVVKELVENSLDSGAAEIRVELGTGGKSFIRVHDDGSGMSPEDAALCFRRHSTSKIATEADLERIATLGFRGEALASIAAVSRVILKTSDGTSGRGLKIEREADKVTSVTEIPFPRGTSVEVRDLFFNLPARLKFLRSDRAELSLAVKYLTQTALAFPRVRFILDHGARRLIDCPAVASSADRIFQLFGKEILERLMEVRAEEDGRKLEGHASLPLTGRGDRSVQHFFVNSRPVKDRTLVASLNQAYSGILEKNRFPECFLFLHLPYEDVDVNVHPAKSEVRFKDSQTVFRLVLKAVEGALGRGPVIKKVKASVSEPEAFSGSPVAGPSPALFGEFSGLPASGGSIGETKTAFRNEIEGGDESLSPAGSLTILGQFDNLYIVAASADGLLIIDQHNAHERVLFEKYAEIDRRREWPRKMLLVPIVVDLSPEEGLRFDENETLLEELGFRADRMGGRTVALKEYPDIFGPQEARQTFMSLLEESSKGDSLEIRKRMLATMACRTAVKAGRKLSFDEMSCLVSELFRTSQPALCPHGRPIVLRIGKSEIERGLRRPVKPVEERKE